MPKRGNDNPQMRREDYEALEARGGGGGGGDGVLSQGFEKASEGVRRKRRIIKASRPKTPSNNNSGVAGSQSEKKTGAFANFSFGTPAAASSTGFGAGSKSESKAASSMGGFSFGASSSSSLGASPPKTSGGFSFTAGESITIAPGSTTKPFSFGSSTNSGSSSSGSGGTSPQEALRNEYQQMANQLHSDFTTFVQPYLGTGADIRKPLARYLDAATLCLKEEYLSKKKKLGGSAPGNAATTKVSFAASPAPAAPLFGVPPQKPAGTPAAATPGFSFTGGSTPAISTPGVVSNTPGLTPAGSTFSASAAPADANSIANADEAAADTGKDDKSDAVLEGDADKDWMTLDVVMNSHFYALTEGTQKREKIAGGGKLKIQEHKESKIRRMIMRNEAVGKVLLNLSVGKGMPVVKLPDGKHKKHISGIENVMIMGVLKEGEKPQKILVRRVIDATAKPLMDVLNEAVKL